jgi:hypothetical protein
MAGTRANQTSFRSATEQSVDAVAARIAEHDQRVAALHQTLEDNEEGIGNGTFDPSETLAAISAADVLRPHLMRALAKAEEKDAEAAELRRVEAQKTAQNAARRRLTDAKKALEWLQDGIEDVARRYREAEEKCTLVGFGLRPDTPLREALAFDLNPVLSNAGLFGVGSLALVIQQALIRAFDGRLPKITDKFDYLDTMLEQSFNTRREVEHFPGDDPAYDRAFYASLPKVNRVMPQVTQDRLLATKKARDDEQAERDQQFRHAAMNGVPPAGYRPEGAKQWAAREEARHALENAALAAQQRPHPNEHDSRERLDQLHQDKLEEMSNG